MSRSWCKRLISNVMSFVERLAEVGMYIKATSRIDKKKDIVLDAAHGTVVDRYHDFGVIEGSS